VRRLVGHRLGRVLVHRLVRWLVRRLAVVLGAVIGG
jgi:hypothetical protein